MALDRLVTIERGRRAEAVRHVPSTLDIFETHFPLFPVLPGVIVVGCLGTLASQLLHSSTDREWRMSAVEGVRFRRFVQPGDVLNLSVQISSLNDDRAVCSALARVDGTRVTTIATLKMTADPVRGAP